MEVATQDIAIITLLLIISAVGIVTLSLRLPYPIALVLAGLALGAIIQIGLGTQVRGGVDIALDNGVPRASALASVGGLSNLHRDAAIIVFAGCFMTFVYLSAKFPEERTVKGWTYIVVAFAALQVGLGMMMSYGSLRPAIQVAHLTVASLLLGAETVVLLLTQTHPSTSSA